MLDCALDSTTVLSFLPMTLVHSNHFNSLPSWNATKEFTDPLLENVCFIVQLFMNMIDFFFVFRYEGNQRMFG